MKTFDDLFLRQIFGQFFLFPILISISMGILIRKLPIVLIFSIMVGLGFQVYSDGGRIVVQGLVAAFIAHMIAALGGFLISKVVR